MLSFHNVVTNKTGKEGMHNAAGGLCSLINLFVREVHL